MSYWDDHGFDPYDDEEIEVTCKYCGCGGLEWVRLYEGWRLFDADGNRHKCNRNDNAAHAFAVPLPTITPPKPLKRSARTGQPVCKCGRGYGSEYDGLCTPCRGITAYEAALKKR